MFTRACGTKFRSVAVVVVLAGLGVMSRGIDSAAAQIRDHRGSPAGGTVRDHRRPSVGGPVRDHRGPSAGPSAGAPGGVSAGKATVRKPPSARPCGSRVCPNYPRR